MAKFSYNALREAAQQRKRIGGWDGYNVYACSKYDYDPKQTHSFYVIYDRDNQLVRGNKVYGTITETGSVDEWSVYGTWKEVAPKPKAKMEYTIPASGYSAFVAGAKSGDVEVPVNVDDFFVRIDKEINELLANADKVDLSVSFGVDK